MRDDVFLSCLCFPNPLPKLLIIVQPANLVCALIPLRSCPPSPVAASPIDSVYTETTSLQVLRYSPFC